MRSLSAVHPADRGSIPDELKNRVQWVSWSFEERGEKTTKVPYQAGASGHARANDSATWRTFEEASKDANRDGIGFVFSSGDPYTGVDLDGCRDPETGEVEAWAQEVVDDLDGYTELSPSGTGLHIIVRGKIRRSGRRGKIEAYSSERYFTMTGEGMKREIPDRQEQLDNLYRKHLEAPTRATSKASGAAATGAAFGSPELPDEQVIEKLTKESSGKGQRLMDGGTGDYADDRSRADQALVSKLYFYTQDFEQIDRIFRRSGLYREKWERTDYRHRTFMKAANSATEVWQPGRSASVVQLGSRSAATEKMEAGENPPEQLTNSDLGNSRRFIRLFGDRVRYCYPWESWIIFDGKRWKPDTSGEIQRLGKEIPKEILREAANTEDDDRRKALTKFALASESRTRIRDALALAASDVPVQQEDFDRDPYLLNVANGTLDLRTGELRGHDREDLITKLAPVEYDPEAEAPTWAAFLARVLPSEAVREFLQKLAGYSLTGDVSEHVLPVFYGVGQNGKSTAVNAMLEAVGDYGMQAMPDLLIAKRGGHPTEVADLFGKRLVASTEIADGGKLNEALVKQLTGGDRIKARRLYENPWEFEPTHKAILSVNHRPEIRGTDTGIWRRIRLIPFTEIVPPKERDTKLPKKLSCELPGILRWMVEGCLQWQREGLDAPDEITAATEEYREDMDILGAFISGCCDEGSTMSATASSLWNAYRNWAKDNNEQEGTQKRFGTRLGERGFSKGKDSKTNRVLWFGLSLNAIGHGYAEPSPNHSNTLFAGNSQNSEPSEPKKRKLSLENDPRVDFSEKGSDGSDGSVNESEEWEREF